MESNQNDSDPDWHSAAERRKGPGHVVPRLRILAIVRRLRRQNFGQYLDDMTIFGPSDGLVGAQGQAQAMAASSALRAFKTEVHRSPDVLQGRKSTLQPYAK